MQTLSYILSWYRQYFGTSALGLGFAAALMWMWDRRRENSKVRALFSYGVMVSAVCLCPVTAKIIMKMIGSRVYWRVFWMLPLVVVLAYTGTEWVFRRPSDTSALRGKAKKAIAALLCVLLVGINGTLVFSDLYFTGRENRYKIPSPVIRMADTITAHSAQFRIKKKNRKVLAPTEVAEVIRLYDASIVQAYGRSTEFNPALQKVMFQQINAGEPDYELLTQKARRRRYSYLILREEQDNRQVMEGLDYEVIFEDNGYVVYFDWHRYRRKMRRKFKAAKDASS